MNAYVPVSSSFVSRPAYLRRVAHLGLRGKLHLCVQGDEAVVEDLLLRHVVPKGLAPVQHLEEHHAAAPHVHLRRDARRAHPRVRFEALGRQVPVVRVRARYT